MKHTRWLRLRVIGDPDVARRHIADAQRILGQTISRAQIGKLDVTTRFVTLSKDAVLRVDFVQGYPIATLFAGTEEIESECKPPSAPEGFVCVPFSTDYPAPTGVAPDVLVGPNVHPEVLLRPSEDTDGFNNTSFEYTAYYYSEDHVPAGAEVRIWHVFASSCPDYDDLTYGWLLSGNADWVGHEEDHLSCSWYGPQRRYMFGQNPTSVTIDGNSYFTVDQYIGVQIYFRGVAIVYDEISLGDRPADVDIDVILGAGMRYVQDNATLEDGLYLFAVVQDTVTDVIRLVRWRVRTDDTFGYIVQDAAKLAEWTENNYCPIALAAFNASCTEMYMLVTEGNVSLGAPAELYGLYVDLTLPTEGEFEVVEADLYNSQTYEYTETLSLVRPHSGSYITEFQDGVVYTCEEICVDAEVFREFCSGLTWSGGNAAYSYNESYEYVIAYDFRGDELVRVKVRQVFTGTKIDSATGSINYSRDDEASFCDAADAASADPNPCVGYDTSILYTETDEGEAGIESYEVTEEINYLVFEYPGVDFELEVYRHTDERTEVASGTHSHSYTREGRLLREDRGEWLPAGIGEECGSIVDHCGDCDTGPDTLDVSISTSGSKYAAWENTIDRQVTVDIRTFYMLDARYESYACIRETYSQVQATVTNAYVGYSVDSSGPYAPVGEYLQTFTDDETVQQQYIKRLFGAAEEVVHTTSCEEHYADSTVGGSQGWITCLGDKCDDNAGCIYNYAHTASELANFSIVISSSCESWSATTGQRTLQATIDVGTDWLRSISPDTILRGGSVSTLCDFNGQYWYYVRHPDTNVAYPWGTSICAFKEAAFLSLPTNNEAVKVIYNSITDSEPVNETMVGSTDVLNTYYPIHFHYDRYPPIGI